MPNNTSESIDSANPPSTDLHFAALLQRIIAELAPLNEEDRRRLLDTVMTFFGVTAGRHEPNKSHSAPPLGRSAPFHFSDEHDAPTPKAFILEKSPHTDVERVACLAYYLSHYRGTPHFKTSDVTALNTESAHRAFSNTADAVDNATKAGYLVPSVKGAKQISAAGEKFVEALPDRESARQVFESYRGRRGNGAKKGASRASKE